jgi:hypothetical protein
VIYIDNIDLVLFNPNSKSLTSPFIDLPSGLRLCVLAPVTTRVAQLATICRLAEGCYERQHTIKIKPVIFELCLKKKSQFLTSTQHLLRLAR